ncbi:MAG: SRPBCC family protein [Lysobacterales bacterium]
MNAKSDRIEREVLIDAPRARVWRALTDHEQFGAWFLVRLEGPFVVGQRTCGQTTYPGYEHLAFEANVEAMDPETRFVFTWPQCDTETGKRYADEPPTRVEFLLDDVEGKTRVRVIESGFERLSPAVRETVHRMNSGGWTEQMENIRKYAEAR